MSRALLISRDYCKTHLGRGDEWSQVRYTKLMSLLYRATGNPHEKRWVFTGMSENEDWWEDIPRDRAYSGDE